METVEIKIEQTKKVASIIKVTMPSFWRDAYGEFIALLDTETVVKLYISPSGNYTSIINAKPSALSESVSDAAANWMICDENEFMDAYNKAHESIRLKPALVENESREFEL